MSEVATLEMDPKKDGNNEIHRCGVMIIARTAAMTNLGGGDGKTGAGWNLFSRGVCDDDDDIHHDSQER